MSFGNWSLDSSGKIERRFAEFRVVPFVSLPDYRARSDPGCAVVVVLIVKVNGVNGVVRSKTVWVQRIHVFYGNRGRDGSGTG